MLPRPPKLSTKSPIKSKIFARALYVSFKSSPYSNLFITPSAEFFILACAASALSE
jgi:hypothetical protein